MFHISRFVFPPGSSLIPRRCVDFHSWMRVVIRSGDSSHPGMEICTPAHCLETRPDIEPSCACKMHFSDVATGSMPEIAGKRRSQ